MNSFYSQLYNQTTKQPNNQTTKQPNNQTTNKSPLVYTIKNSIKLITQN